MSRNKHKTLEDLGLSKKEMEKIALVCRKGFGAPDHEKAKPKKAGALTNLSLPGRQHPRQSQPGKA